MTKKIAFLLFLFLIIPFTVIISQASFEDDFFLPLNFGFSVNGSLDFLSSDVKFYTTNSDLLATLSQNKLFNGIGLNGIINYPVKRNIFFTGRIGYNYFSGKFDYQFFDTTNNQTSTYPSAVPTKVGYFEIMPGIQIYNLIRNAPYFYFLGGFEFGLINLSKYQNIQLGTPEVDIPNTNTRIALVLGAGYTFKLSPTVLLSPEGTFRINLNKLANYEISNSVGYRSESFSFAELRFGASITFTSQKYLSDGYYRGDQSPIVRITQVRTYDAEGKHVLVEALKVEDTKYQELFPLVPYVFFEQNSATFQPGTQIIITSAEAGEFNPTHLEMDALEINKHLLDIVGFRLRENQGAEITLTGTIDGSRIEQQNKQLAQQRANFVKDYLVKTWGINPERINTRTTNLPSKPSTNTDPEGMAENRRVELASSNPNILEPILIAGENNRIAQPNLIEFVPEVLVRDSIVSWMFTLYQGNQLLRQFTGSGMPTLQTWNIRPNELANKSLPIDYVLDVQPLHGEKITAKGSIPVEYYSYSRKKSEELSDRQISKYSLVLFDFDKADVSQSDLDLIEKYIIPSIKYNSIVKIYGYTDRIGEEVYNLNLAGRRAETVKTIIKKQLKDVKIETYAVGERTLLFDNNFSTGRHLSRTVQILVVTPR